MIRYIFFRLFSAIPVLLGVVTLVFFLLHLIPGDPVDLMLGESAQPAQREELRKSLHLDEPVMNQYVRFVEGAVRFDWGHSISTSEPVWERIRKRAPATFLLALASLLIAILFSIPIGLFAAWKRGSSLDHTAMSFSLLGLAMPAFWLGPILILIFAYKLRWCPISGMEEPASLLLPALTLGAGMSALLIRMTRNSVVEILHEDYIQTAIAKGLPTATVFIRHAFRSALLPVVTIVGLQTGALLSGAVITERVFSWPGIGSELVFAIERRDYPLVQGCVLLIALSYVIVNLATDLLYAWIDPRIRLKGDVKG